MIVADDKIVGFVENSSDPTNLQAWCEACERMFLSEGDKTPAFIAFNQMALVCDICYASFKERHSSLEGDT